MTQISLGIHPVWSVSSLSTWRNIGPLPTYWAHSEDSDQTGRMPMLICLCWAHMSFCWFCLVEAHLRLGLWQNWSVPEQFSVSCLFTGNSNWVWDPRMDTGFLELWSYFGSLVGGCWSVKYTIPPLFSKRSNCNRGAPSLYATLTQMHKKYELNIKLRTVWISFYKHICKL